MSGHVRLNYKSEFHLSVSILEEFFTQIISSFRKRFFPQNIFFNKIPNIWFRLVALADK